MEGKLNRICINLRSKRYEMKIRLWNSNEIGDNTIIPLKIDTTIILSATGIVYS